MLVAVAAASAVLGVAVAAPAADDGLGSPVYGKRVAEEQCGDCHVVTPEQGKGGDPLAPDLVERVRDPAITEMALRSWLRTSHPNMPNIRLTEQQTDDVVAYLLSIKGAK